MDKDQNYNVGACDHAEEIGEAMYDVYRIETNTTNLFWDELPEDEKKAWKAVAKNSLKIIGQHAADDIKAYAKDQFKLSGGWLKALWGAVIGAALVGGTLLSNSCSTVDHMIFQGEKGTVHYYTTEKGERVLVVNPAKVEPSKK